MVLPFLEELEQCVEPIQDAVGEVSREKNWP